MKVAGNDTILRRFEEENYRENQANKGGYSKYVANGYQRMSVIHVVKASERNRKYRSIIHPLRLFKFQL